jgi:hypothetical protein
MWRDSRSFYNYRGTQGVTLIFDIGAEAAISSVLSGPRWPMVGALPFRAWGRLSIFRNLEAFYRRHPASGYGAQSSSMKSSLMKHSHVSAGKAQPIILFMDLRRGQDMPSVLPFSGLDMIFNLEEPDRFRCGPHGGLTHSENQRLRSSNSGVSIRERDALFSCRGALFAGLPQGNRNDGPGLLSPSGTCRAMKGVSICLEKGGARGSHAMNPPDSSHEGGGEGFCIRVLTLSWRCACDAAESGRRITAQNYNPLQSKPEGRRMKVSSGYRGKPGRPSVAGTISR